MTSPKDIPAPAMKLTVERSSRAKDWLLLIVCLLSTCIGGAALFTLLAYVVVDAAGWLDWQFLSSTTSRFPEKAGIFPALVGSIYMAGLMIPPAMIMGIGAAVYLTEYAKPSWLTRFIEINIANLAGVPSVVWGLLGLGLFIQLFDMTYGTLLVGALTMALLILPVITIASREAIKAVPDSLRQAAYGIGATKWQTISRIVLPRALPGILTGTVLSLARALGETAPLIPIAIAHFCTWGSVLLSISTDTS